MNNKAPHAGILEAIRVCREELGVSDVHQPETTREARNMLYWLRGEVRQRKLKNKKKQSWITEHLKCTSD